MAARELAIDTALRLANDCQSARLRLVLVVADGREATVRHVTAGTGVPVAVVPQQQGMPELVGALRSALLWCEQRTLVLLPDQVLTAPAPRLLDRALEALERTAACFIAAAESDPERIARDGALATTVADADGNRVATALADKPGLARAEQFDAVWFGLGFRAEAATTALEDLHAAAEQRLDPAGFQAGPWNGAAVVDCPPFFDTGTWPDLTTSWRTACG